MLEVELTGHCGPMATRSGQNILESEKMYVVVISKTQAR